MRGTSEIHVSKRAIRAIAFMALVAIGARAIASGKDDEVTSLRGLKKVFVVVGETTDDSAALGLDDKQISTLIERQLRKEGVLVAAKAGDAATAGSYLRVDLVLRRDRTGYAFNLNLKFMQYVKLVRSPDVAVYASTWSDGASGECRPADGGEYVRKALTDFVERFVNDYEKANGK
jgi:hypothetical protein